MIGFLVMPLTQLMVPHSELGTLFTNLGRLKAPPWSRTTIRDPRTEKTPSGRARLWWPPQELIISGGTVILLFSGQQRSGLRDNPW